MTNQLPLPTLRIVRNERTLLRAMDASSFLSRLRGLLGRPPLGLEEAMLIRPCSDIHTFGMRYTIEVAFLDQQGCVMKLQTVAPSRVAWCRRAHAALEMCEGTIDWLGISMGQQLLVQPMDE